MYKCEKWAATYLYPFELDDYDEMMKLADRSSIFG